MNQPCNTCLPPRQSALATLQHMFAATAKCSCNLQEEFAATAKINKFPQNKKQFPNIFSNLLLFVPIRLIRVRFFVPSTLYVRHKMLNAK